MTKFTMFTKHLNSCHVSPWMNTLKLSCLTLTSWTNV